MCQSSFTVRHVRHPGSPTSLYFPLSPMCFERITFLVSVSPVTASHCGLKEFNSSRVITCCSCLTYVSLPGKIH